RKLEAVGVPCGSAASASPQSRHRDGLEYLGKNPDWGESLGSSATIKAEGIHAVRREMAQKLANIILRRTHLGSGNRPEPRRLQICADLMASELGWDDSRTQKELDEVQMLYPAWVKADATEAHV